MSKKKNRAQPEVTEGRLLEENVFIFRGGPLDGQKFSFDYPVNQQTNTPTTIRPDGRANPYIWQHTKYIDDEYEPRVETLYSYFDKKDFS